QADALLAHHHRADIGRRRELDEMVDRIAGEDLHALALEDFGDGGSDFHGRLLGLGRGQLRYATRNLRMAGRGGPSIHGVLHAEAAMLTFYFAPGSSSMAPHIGLHEVGAPFEPKPMSFKNGDLRKPEYLAINPEGKVPTLLIDGRPLTEVAAILCYLARAFPAAGLLPDNPEAEAQAISWMSFIASSLHPARARGLDRVKVIYGIADKRLGKNEWAIGRYSIADIHLFRLYWRI